MIPLFRAVGMFALTALCACSEERQPLDHYLAQLRPGTVAKLPDMGWPSGTMLCPLTTYQDQLHGSEPPADRVNAFLTQKQFKGDEGHWSLIVVRSTPAGDAGIEQLTFKRAGFDIINEAGMLKRDAETVPAGFVLKTCVPAEQVRILVTRTQSSNRNLIIFGTE